MSFADIGVAGWLAIGSAVATTAATVYSADKAATSQKNALKQAQANALLTQQQADVANNKANARAPDSSALLAANMAAGANGQASTMLTGPGGIDPSQLTLGKTSLLGG